MPRYRIEWNDIVGFYTYVRAHSEEEALRKFDSGEIDTCEPDGYCELEEDSVKVYRDEE